MPISRLPEATARELGSTLAVSTPIAVFKELLENALDAGASFVDIIISLDTLSRIEIRDNGHGISTEDLDALGRSGYTSKINTFDDVIALGGKSLGFRGVALASINAVAEITLTTKTAADPVAAMFQLLPGGGVARKQHVSAPVGTTVYVTKLFSRTPVREKVAARESKKNIIAIKELLQAYALARPHVKLLLRVVNGDHTLPWSHSPKPNGDIKDAIIQLFGTELASSCAERTLCRDQPREPSSSTQDSNESSSTMTWEQNSHSLAFEAYLPHSFADATRINKRAFFSVDSRPVLTKRGTLKKLYDIFKVHLSRSMSSSGQIQLPTAPFIRLNIRCEPRSYDINVEPSKDDVLFHDEGYLIKKFEEFMLSVYPVTPASPGTRPETALSIPSGVEPQQSSLSSATSRLSLNPQAPIITSQSTPLSAGAPSVCYPSPGRGQRLGSGDNTHNSRPVIQAPSTFIPGRSSFTPINLPKTVLGAYPTPPGPSQNPFGPDGSSEIALAIRGTESERSPSIRPAAFVGSPIHSMRTSAVGRDNPHSTNRCRIAPGGDVNHTGDELAHPRCPPIQSHPRLVLDNVLPTPSMHTGGVQSLPNIQYRPFRVDMSTCFIDSDDEEELPRNSVPRPRPLPTGRDRVGELDETEEPLRSPLEGLNPWSIAKLTASRRRPHQPRPQPVVEDRDVEDLGERMRRPTPTAKGSFQPRQYNSSNFAGQPRKPPFKASGGAFKVPGGAYKKPTMNEARPRGRPEPMVQTTLSRYRAPGHPGHTNARTEEGPKDPVPQPICSQNASSSAGLPTEDPRSYLFNDGPAVNNPQRKLRRCKTDLLPLEKTPLGSETYPLRLTLNVKTQDLANLVDIVSDLDRYYIDGKFDRALYDNITRDEIQKLITRAKAMLEE